MIVDERAISQPNRGPSGLVGRTPPPSSCSFIEKACSVVHYLGLGGGGGPRDVGKNFSISITDR